ncbi:MAG: hypothetical protein WA102_04235 [Candidatus Methanoperedens sp.]
MPKKAMWLVYDFDIGGDYEGLYKWLDIREAKECGNGVAFLYFEYKNNFYPELKKSLGQIKFKNRDRIYVIYKEPKRMRGKWVHGGRKKTPWAGYAVTDTGEEEIREEEE